MNIIICKCGHKINDHVVGSGCMKVERLGNTDSVCQCLRSPQDIADDELAALEAVAEAARTGRGLDDALDALDGVK